MLCERFAELPRIKLVVDFDDVWSDIVTHYKKKNLIFESQICVVLRGCNTIDTGVLDVKFIRLRTRHLPQTSTYDCLKGLNAFYDLHVLQKPGHLAY